MRTLKLFADLGLGSKSFIIERGGLLRHILHSCSIFNPGAGNHEVVSMLKTNPVSDFDDDQNIQTLSFLHMSLATAGGTEPALGALTREIFMNFVDLSLPDRSSLYFVHDILVGGVSAEKIWSAAILFIEDL